MRKLLESYARSHDPAYFAPDAVLTLSGGAEQRFVGRFEIAAGLRRLYAEAFSQPRVDVRRVAIDSRQGAGVVELVLRGLHTGELLGIPPSFEATELPIVAVYELGRDEIQGGRLYFDATRLRGRTTRGA